MQLDVKRKDTKKSVIGVACGQKLLTCPVHRLLTVSFCESYMSSMEQ
jgi:hypothetical protein